VDESFGAGYRTAVGGQLVQVSRELALPLRHARKEDSMGTPTTVRRVLGVIFLVLGFFLVLTTIIAIGNDLGLLEAALLFLASALLVGFGWRLWASGQVIQSNRPT
jgi:hypothetical protein